MRRSHEGGFKGRVAMGAWIREKTVAPLSSEVGVHANQTRLWRQRLLDEALHGFSDHRRK